MNKEIYNISFDNGLHFLKINNKESILIFNIWNEEEDKNRSSVLRTIFLINQTFIMNEFLHNINMG